MSADDLIVLTPPGWAAVASERLAVAFPGLGPHTPHVQAILRPLFRQAIDVALEHAYQGLLTPEPNPEQPRHEDPPSRS